MRTESPPVGIVSAGMYIPSQFWTSADIAQASGIPEDIIRTKLGLHRMPIPGPDDHTNQMGVWAAQDAIRRAGMDPLEIDVVLCTTEEHKEWPLWTAGIKLAYDVGARNAWAIDVQLRCSTTMPALKLAKALMLEDERIETVLIAGGYRNFDYVDRRNPRATFMYGLAAGGGALLLRRGYERNHLLETAVIVDGTFSLDVYVPVGGTVEPATPETVGGPRHKLDVLHPEDMKRRLNDNSAANFFRVIDEALERSGLSRADVGYLAILHIKPSFHRHVLQELGLSDEQTFYLCDYGHIGQQDQAISIVEGLRTGRLKDGDVVVLVGAGVGYAWAASVVKWGE
jgi:3-oxoacyl-[acyl-carrier-protein] synthase-3